MVDRYDRADIGEEISMTTKWLEVGGWEKLVLLMCL